MERREVLCSVIAQPTSPLSILPSPFSILFSEVESETYLNTELG